MFQKIKRFLSEVKAEMSKVTWSTRSELWSSTLIVLSTMLFLSVLIGMVDLFFSQILKFIMR